MTETTLSEANRIEPRRPNIEDVARRAGVSTATVSRCLNNPQSVRERTRSIVETAVTELGYTPHFGARALALNRTHTIGAIIPTMENAIFARGLQAVQERLSENGTTLLLASSGYDPVQEATQLRTLIQRGVDSVLLIGEARPDSTYALLKNRPIPVVLAWCHKSSSDHVCVGFDNRAAAVEMTRLVLEHGHRDIAMIAGITDWNDRAAGRVSGVRDALEAAGLDLTDHNLIEAEYTFEAGAAAFRRLADRSTRPTAIICGNDILAVGVIQAAKAMGLRVPEDVSVTGFDDIDVAAIIEPTLTTVHVPHRRMGWCAADILLDLQTGAERGENICFETDLIVRNSLGHKPAASPG
jgi:LacI family transcriptional regulator